MELGYLASRNQIRLAEMESKKAENILKHEGEIFSRPKKTWFQTSKEKTDAKGLRLFQFFDLIVFSLMAL